MATKKLLDRFENSPKVWTIKLERNENGCREYVKKVYNSIADAHRDNPKISCSHIEDYCNATFFTKSNHWFAYEGYMMAPSINEILNGDSYEAVVPDKENPDTIYFESNDPFCEKKCDVRKIKIAQWMSNMWNEIANEFLGDTYVFSKRYPETYYSDGIIADAMINLEYYQISKFMQNLYQNGWHKGMFQDKIKEWCTKNISRMDLLLPDAEPLVVVQKPEKKYWRSQEYKQQMYL